MTPDEALAELKCRVADRKATPLEELMINEIERLHAENETLKAAARRLLPADGYIKPVSRDDTEVNLLTCVGALRQLMRALGILHG